MGRRAAPYPTSRQGILVQSAASACPKSASSYRFDTAAAYATATAWAPVRRAINRLATLTMALTEAVTMLWLAPTGHDRGHGGPHGACGLSSGW